MLFAWRFVVGIANPRVFTTVPVRVVMNCLWNRLVRLDRVKTGKLPTGLFSSSQSGFGISEVLREDPLVGVFLRVDVMRQTSSRLILPKH